MTELEVRNNIIEAIKLNSNLEAEDDDSLLFENIVNVFPHDEKNNVLIIDCGKNCYEVEITKFRV